jgi:angiomotin like
MAEAQQEKFRLSNGANSANRNVTELQTRLKVVENRLNEKDAMIRALQGKPFFIYCAFNIIRANFSFLRF